MKVVVGIEKLHEVTSSRVLTIDVSHDTSIGKSLSDDRFSRILYSNFMSYSKCYEYPF